MLQNGSFRSTSVRIMPLLLYRCKFVIIPLMFVCFFKIGCTYRQNGICTDVFYRYSRILNHNRNFIFLVRCHRVIFSVLALTTSNCKKIVWWVLLIHCRQVCKTFVNRSTRCANNSPWTQNRFCISIIRVS